jgi:hypothetical protein
VYKIQIHQKVRTKATFNGGRIGVFQLSGFQKQESKIFTVDAKTFGVSKI